MKMHDRVVFVVTVLFGAATAISALGVVVSHDGVSMIPSLTDELSRARDVQQVLAYAVVALSLALSATAGYVVRMLSTVIRENTAAMARCEERVRSAGRRQRPTK